jgi:hypothetical protein
MRKQYGRDTTRTSVQALTAGGIGIRHSAFGKTSVPAPQLERFLPETTGGSHPILT